MYRGYPELHGVPCRYGNLGSLVVSCDVIARKPYFPSVPAELAKLFRAEGLELLGVAEALPDERSEGLYRRWLDRGYASSMAYLRDHAPLKFHPERILPGTRSVLVAGVNYYQEAEGRLTSQQAAPLDGTATAHDAYGSTAPGADTQAGARTKGSGPTDGATGAQPAAGRIARYAWGRDYHRLLGGKLKRVAAALSARYPSERFRSFTDATPLAERHYAEAAGVGFTGRNTLLISSQYGSWFLIGEILSTMALPASGPPEGRHGACPSGCRRCLDVCPTGALVASGEIDASRCISYLTIEHKGSIRESLRPLMGDWLFGCDLCQEVCPLNLQAKATGEKDFLAWRAGSSRELAAVLAIADEAEFTRHFAGSPLMRARRSGLLRNACIVAANLGARELLPRLRERTLDSDPVIAEHARWALVRLAD